MRYRFSMMLIVQNAACHTYTHNMRTHKPPGKPPGEQGLPASRLATHRLIHLAEQHGSDKIHALQPRDDHTSVHCINMRDKLATRT